jgi:hypothetical protein
MVEEERKRIPSMKKECLPIVALARITRELPQPRVLSRRLEPAGRALGTRPTAPLLRQSK